MPKEAYAAAFIITIIILIFCIRKTCDYKKKIAREVRTVMIYAAVAVFASLILLFSDSRLLSMVSYSVYFICMDWLLWALFEFSVAYAGYRVEDIVKRRPIGIIMGADSISLAANVRTEHAFECHEITLGNGDIYYRFSAKLPYEIHLGIAYFLCVLIFAVLIYKIVKSPSVYRQKYLIVLGILALLVVVDMVYLYIQSAVDAAILLYAIAGVCIFYSAFFYAPKGLLNQTLTLVAEDMTEALLVFDIYGVCIGANGSAKELLGIEAEQEWVSDGDFLDWCMDVQKEDRESFIEERTMKKGGDILNLRVQFQRLKDKKERFVGTFFIIHDHTEEEKHIRADFYRASHDSLTGLYNKEYFYDMVQKKMRENPDTTYLMLCSEIQNYKMLAEVFGSATADELLIRIGNVLRERALSMHVYGRLENDKFALLLRKEDYKEELFRQMSDVLTNKEYNVTFPLEIFIGVYEIDTPFIPTSVMCARASAALEYVRRGESRQIAWYDEKLRESEQREQEFGREMEDALRNGEFQIYLQPQISAAGELLGAEALVRWVHPRRGIIMPYEFLPVFEKNGMVASLDRYVWELACSCLKQWKAQGRDDLYISVNISPKDFYLLDIRGILLDMTKEYGILPQNLSLEITEDAVIMNVERQIRLIEELKSSGFSVEMDGFGGWYSSINLLRDAKVNAVKINVNGERRKNGDESFESVLKAMIDLSGKLNVPVIAEGVETEAQAAFLKDAGCEVFQGYYYAKPMEVSKFEEKYM